MVRSVSEQLYEIGTIVAIINLEGKRGLESFFHFSKPLLWSSTDCSLNQDPHSLTMNVSLIRKSKHIPTLLGPLRELLLRFPGFWLFDFKMKPNPFLRPTASQVNCPVFISSGSSWTIFPIMHWSVWPFMLLCVAASAPLLCAAQVLSSANPWLVPPFWEKPYSDTVQACQPFPSFCIILPNSLKSDGSS